MLVFYHTYSFVWIEFELKRLTNGFPIYFLFYYHLKSIKITVGLFKTQNLERASWSEPKQFETA